MLTPAVPSGKSVKGCRTPMTSEVTSVCAGNVPSMLSTFCLLTYHASRQRKNEVHSAASGNCSASSTSRQLLTSLRVYRQTNGCIMPVTFLLRHFHSPPIHLRNPLDQTLKVEGPRGSLELQGHAYQTGVQVQVPVRWAGREFLRLGQWQNRLLS